MSEPKDANCYKPLQLFVWKNPHSRAKFNMDRVFTGLTTMARGTKREILVERKPQLRRLIPTGAVNGRLELDAARRAPLRPDDVWPKRQEPAAAETPAIDDADEDAPEPLPSRRDPVSMEAAFEDGAEKKVAKLLDAFDSLKILSDWTRFRFHPDQVEEIKAVITAAFTETMEAFESGTGPKKKFRLKSRRHT